jgi:hypothetical protein
MIVAVGGCYAMELHSMLRRNIAHMSTIIRSFAGCRSFRDVREAADVGRYQRCAANVAPVALSAAAAFPGDRRQHDDAAHDSRQKCASAFALLLCVCAFARGLVNAAALRLSNRYSDAMNDQTRTADAMNDQTRTDRARRGNWSWRVTLTIPQMRQTRSGYVRVSTAKQANEWHRWYAWHPVICDNASGGVAWGLTILRRRKRGQWVYRMRLRNRDIQWRY